MTLCNHRGGGGLGLAGWIMRTRDPRSGGAHGVDSRYNTWRSGHLGLTHTETQTQVVDDWRAEVHGQQQLSNDPRNNRNLGTPTTVHR